MPHPSSGCAVWLTGLPASGKTTLARALEAKLQALGRPCIRLDGDELRRTVCAGLGFSPADRTENIRRAATLARAQADTGLVVIAAFISPLRAHRALARRIVAPLPFVEVHVAAPVAVCRARDPKGHYARADRGELKNFTGVSAPYDPPEHPEVTVASDQLPVETCIQRILAALPSG